MKTIIVVSDTHGNMGALDKLRPLIAENDYFIHLGDGFTDIREIRKEFPDKTYFCAGNCDFFAPVPAQGMIDIEQCRIFYCHGHTYGVKNGLEKLAAEAKRQGCDVALYGHTHTALYTEIDGVKLINPGAIKYTANTPVYLYLVINGAKCTHVFIGDNLQ